MKNERYFDNGGETCDRYTIIIDGSVYGMSHNPTSPQGFNQYCGEEGEFDFEDNIAFRYKMCWEALPVDVQKAIIERREDKVQEGNRPMPGDVVRILNPKDCLITDKSYGIIEGIEGRFEEQYLVCFNAYSIFRGVSSKYATDKNVSITASGGPAFYIAPESLYSTDEQKDMEFWKWKDHPRADGGVRYSQACRVWEYQSEV